jgi:putative Mg2+ transporter-C (MgtC) family protein
VDLDFDLIVLHLQQLCIAFGLALPIAINREQYSTGAGLRTFPLVCIASCAFALVGMSVFTGDDAESRVLYGVITGMGFIGGGSIIKNAGAAYGTATAAGLWLTGAIGVSVAYQRYEISLVLSLIGFLIFQFSKIVKNDDL